ncbi:MAG: class I SAM-dependent methyltransferase [Chloroflexi bacterium]|nr:class I SAM-dependent methyltransferase [Chloroflexota bacterium]
MPLPTAAASLIPAAGEGVALLTLADKLDLEPFGIELHEGRAKKAQELVQQGLARRLQASRSAVLPHLPTRRILHDSYTGLITSRGGYNLLYLNPPYDHDDEDGRLEYQWLKLCRPHLQPGGVLIWVVPQHLLKFAPAARYIAGWYEKVQVFRFPDPEYAQFRQVVLFGVLRPRPIPPDSELVEKLSLLASGLFPLPVLAPASEPVYTLPPLKVPDKQFIFRSWMVDPDEALVEVREQGARTTAAWREHLDAAANHVPLRPLTPLKIGHMSSVIAAGHLNNQVLTASPDPDPGDGTEPGGSGTQTRLLIKGRNYKTIRQSSFSEPLPDGKTRITYLDTEQVVTDITSVNAQGEIIRYKGPELETFLQQWITPLTDLVAQSYPPVYQFNLNGYGPILNSLSRGRVIPGLNGQTGLLPAQKHAAAAALTRLEKARDSIIVGEMGSGKSAIGAAIAAGMNARRTIILCPPHLVDKWQREARIVWPGVRAMALETISDVDAFFGDQPDSAPLIGVVKQTTARSASGWEHAYDLIGPASHSYGSKGYDEVRRNWGDVSSPIKLLDLPAEERQWRGRTLSERQIMALQGRGVCCPVCGEQQMNRDVPLSVREFKSATRRCDNPKCRSPLYQFSRNRSASQQRGSFLLYGEREKLIRQYTDQGEEVPYTIRERWTGSAVRDTFGYGKVPLSAYIKHRAKGRLDLVLIDEAHQYKGIDSDQGYAMHHLAQSARKVVALTGTVYGGKASSLFHLLFRLSPEMNHVYVDRDETGQRRVKHKEWITSYGILQTIETVTLDEDGKQTANSRSNARMKELPGGSPAMLPWLLNRSVFLSLSDMGFPLPEYTEIPVSIPMAPEQEELYESLKEQLKEELKERLVKGDKSLLAGYLYALLFWPDSPRRGKVVTCPRDGKVVASIPRLSDTFVGPKERAIIELCQQEKAQGRRVLLLCGQTDTLDIQPEWKQMLADAGLKAAILRAEPNKREKWVEQQVQAGVDVLISHPRKVETGLGFARLPYDCLDGGGLLRLHRTPGQPPLLAHRPDRAGEGLLLRL